MNILFLLLLGLVPAFGYAYEMMIKHQPWWSNDMNSNELGSSYQFYRPYYKEHHKKNTFRWNHPTSSMNFRKISMPKMPKIPPVPYVPKKPLKMSEERWRAMNSREWPEWIPPIRMIKLPLDEPPAF